MNCDFLEDYLNRSLSAESAAAFEQHMTLCAACREAVDQDVALLDLLRESVSEFDAPASGFVDDMRRMLAGDETTASVPFENPAPINAQPINDGIDFAEADSHVGLQILPSVTNKPSNRGHWFVIAATACVLVAALLSVTWISNSPSSSLPKSVVKQEPGQLRPGLNPPEIRHIPSIKNSRNRPPAVTFTGHQKTFEIDSGDPNIRIFMVFPGDRPNATAPENTL